MGLDYDQKQAVMEILPNLEVSITLVPKLLTINKRPLRLVGKGWERVVASRHPNTPPSLWPSNNP